MALAEIWAPSGTRSNTSHRVEQGPTHHTEWNKVQHITPSGTRSNTSHWETAVTRVGYGSETSDMALAEIWAPSGTRSNTSHRVEQGPTHHTEWNKVQHITLGNSCDTSRLWVRDLWHGSNRDLCTEWNKVHHMTPGNSCTRMIDHPRPSRLNVLCLTWWATPHEGHVNTWPAC